LSGSVEKASSGRRWSDRGEGKSGRLKAPKVRAKDSPSGHYKTVTVAGKELTVHDLKPGMKLQRTTITSTTPRMITTVKTVTGKVWRVSPPNSVILTLEDGTNQSFNIPKGQKFNVDGQETDAWGLKEGMNISATAVIGVSS
jgi:hypothetical protein